jgi:hypothetical protein
VKARFFRFGGLACVALVFAAQALASIDGKDQGWRRSFSVDKSNLVDTGRSTYFVLEPGYALRLEDGGDSLTITVLNETRIVDGVKTRVVEERETKGGQLIEVSRNYFAIDQATKDVYYFGEEVDIYKDGKVSGHEGQWLSGVHGAKFGLMMPGTPRVGDKYYQEDAPKVAMDRAEIVTTSEEFKVPAGVFQNCLRTRESSALEKGVADKMHAPNVGLIKDGSFTLVKVETASK